jgi:hypothetical protein
MRKNVNKYLKRYVICTESLFGNVIVARPFFTSPQLILLLLSFGTRLAAGQSPATTIAAGPIFHQFELTLKPGYRTEAAGPLFFNQWSSMEHTWGIPPLFTHMRDSELDMEELDFLYPLMTYDRYGKQSRWQFMQLLSVASTPSEEEAIRRRFTIFPIFFLQRSTDPTENYTAFIPFYGHIKNHLFRDEVRLVMWPIYIQSRKKDVVTDNYVYPFFHLRHGDGLEGWQFWPLLGHEHKELTRSTNRFDELELVGGHDYRFGLWPIYYQNRAGLGTMNVMTETAVLPLYSVTRSPQRDVTTVIWPFFNKIEDREKNYVEWQAFWPVVEVARGEGKHANRVLPFFSVARSPELESQSYLWPVYKFERVRSAPLDRSRRRILFFLYSDIREENTETKGVRRRTDLLPLFTRHRDFNGSTRLQVLAPLEIFTIGSHKIERDWSPVWSVWRDERNAETGATSQSLLWNLYRRDQATAQKKVSLLFGLFQYQSDSGGKKVRLFYIPLRK